MEGTGSGSTNFASVFGSSCGIRGARANETAACKRARRVSNYFKPSDVVVVPPLAEPWVGRRVVGSRIRMWVFALVNCIMLTMELAMVLGWA